MIAPAGREIARQRAAETKVMRMVMIKITSFPSFCHLVVIKCEPHSALVDLSLIGGTAVRGVN